MTQKTHKSIEHILLHGLPPVERGFGPETYPANVPITRLVHRDPDRPDVWRVPLIRSGKLWAIIDAEDAARVGRFAWCLTLATERSPGHPTCTCMAEGERHQLLARFVMGIGVGDKRFVMHINDDPLDCTKANLLVCDKYARSAASRKKNAPGRRPPASRFKGVSRHEPTGKWQARITVNAESTYLGLFQSEFAAAEAWDDAAFDLRGPTCRLNFPDRYPAAVYRNSAAKPE